VTGRILVVFDIDSTLINEEGLDMVAAHMGPDVAARVADITHRAMAGELDFAESLIQRVALLEGCPTALLAEVAASLTLSPGALELIDEVHRRGGLVGAVSGGFHELVDGLAEEACLDHWLANRFETSGDTLTGRLVGDIVDAESKADFLTHWATHYGIPQANTVAIGDGANDVLMFDAAGLSVSFCGRSVANERADICLAERNLAHVIEHLPGGGSVTHSESTVDGDHRARNVAGGV
jgi:phosphoserine phosphatase